MAGLFKMRNICCIQNEAAEGSVRNSKPRLLPQKIRFLSDRQVVLCRLVECTMIIAICVVLIAAGICRHRLTSAISYSEGSVWNAPVFHFVAML